MSKPLTVKELTTRLMAFEDDLLVCDEGEAWGYAGTHVAMTSVCTRQVVVAGTDGPPQTVVVLE